jgi:hypothetical protein
MRERAARIGGTFALTSSSDAGTEIRLVVPGKIIFQTQKPIRQTLLAKLRNIVLRTFKKTNWTKAEFRWHTYAVSGMSDLIGDPKLSHPSVTTWLNKAAFQKIAAFSYGDAPRNLPNDRTQAYVKRTPP